MVLTIQNKENKNNMCQFLGLIWLNCVCQTNHNIFWVWQHTDSIVVSKAGQLVGIAGCYADIVIADNATFLLAVNHIAAYRADSAIITLVIMCSRGSVGIATAPQFWGRGFEPLLGHDFSTCLCPSRHTRSARNYPPSASAERATPKPHSLRFNIPRM